jgi:hypothetical protein
MKTSHMVLGIGAAALGLGGLYYFGTRGGTPKQYYPGAQGIPVNRVGGAPGNAQSPTASNYSSQTAQLISASAGAAVALLPSLKDLFSGDGGDPTNDEVTGSVEGLAYDEQGI